MKRTSKITNIILLLLLVNFTNLLNSGFYVSTETSSPQVLNDLETSSAYLTIGDLNWTFESFAVDGVPILNNLTTEDTYEYSISSSEIFVQENDSYLAAVGAYTTVPVIDGHLVYSCYLRARSDLAHARKMYVFYYNSFSLELISGLPTLRYYPDDVSFDTGYNYAEMDIPLEGHDEVIMLFCYYDSWLAQYNQSFWVKDLHIPLDGVLPQEPELENIGDLDSLNWTVDSFRNEQYDFEDLVPVTGNEGKYIHSVNETHLHLAENGTGIDNARVGAYLTLPVHNQHIAFSFKATGTATTHANIRHLLYNPYTMEQIPKQLTVTFQNTPEENVLDYTIKVDIKVDDLEEVILLFYFVDSYSLNQNHSYWVSDLKIQPTGIYDLDWTKASFAPNHVSVYAEPKPEGFDYSINSTHIHIFETSSTGYNLFAGVYTPVQVINDTFSISFEGRATSSRYDQIIMGVGIIDPQTMLYLGVRRPYDYQDTGISTYHDTGYNTFSYDFDVTGYEEVLLFSYYIDATVSNWGQNVWVTNLNYTGSPIIYSYTDPPLISHMLLIPPGGEEPTAIAWFISENSYSGHYWIYVNDSLLTDADWDSEYGSVAVAVSFSGYPVGTYNFTIVVTDKYDNLAFDTVFYTVEEDEIISITPSETPSTTIDYFTLPLLIVSFFIAGVVYFVKRRK
ncbi:MAG: hypothetical protein ACTSQF_09955 [Candidatus Heimdallarchaeaceae archaeon]